MTKEEFEKYCNEEIEYLNKYVGKDNFDYHPADQYFSWIYMGRYQPFKELIQSEKLKDDLFDDIRKLKLELVRVQNDLHEWIIKACGYLKYIYQNDSNLSYQKKAALFDSAAMKILNGFNSELIIQKFVNELGLELEKRYLDYLHKVLDRRDIGLKNVLVLIEKRILSQPILSPKKNKGRDYTFDIALTEKWYIELSNNKDYQKHGGKPYIKRIIQEIIHRFEKETGEKPSDETIKNHLRKIKKMRGNKG